MILAAVGKLVPPQPWREVLAAGVEIAAAALLLIPATALVGETIFVGVAAGYVAYASLQPGDATCTCFGSLLPRTVRFAQLVRNCCLFAGALLALTISLSNGQSQAAGAVGADFGLAIGLIVGIVGLPWLATWAYAPVANVQRHRLRID